jgi:hypothetical protein
MKQIASVDGLAPWAHRILLVKNKLREEDARRLEEAFVAIMQTVSGQKDVVEIADVEHRGLVSDSAMASPLGASEPSSHIPPPQMTPGLSNEDANDWLPNRPHIDKSVRAFLSHAASATRST